MTSDGDLTAETRAMVGEVFAHLRNGNHAAALDASERLGNLAAGDALSLYVMGVVAHALDDNGRAIDVIGQAMDRGPECREYADTLAVLCTLEGRLADGLYYAKLSTTLESDSFLAQVIPANLMNYFQALRDVKPSRHRLSAAVQLMRRNYAHAAMDAEKDIRLNPREGYSYGILGQARLELGEPLPATEALRAAAHLDPAEPLHLAHLGRALYRAGRHWEAAGVHTEALARDPDALDVPAIALAEARNLGADGAAIAARFRAALAERVARAVPRDEIAEPAPFGNRSRVRVGVLSDALFHGEIANVLGAVIPHLSATGVDVWIYQQSFVEDGATVRLKSLVPNWRAVRNLDDDTLASIVAGDDLDVVLDLCGASPEHRLAMLARRPVAARVGWLGGGGGVGLPAIDAVLSDPVLETVDRADLAPGQTLIVIERGLIVLDPPVMPEPNAAPMATNGFVTFGARADLATLTPETAAAWARVLKAVAGSRLLLDGPFRDRGASRDQALSLFADFGVVDRIAFVEGDPIRMYDPAFHNTIDVFLDGVTVSGGAYLAESLWMGVPALAIAGATRAARIGASLLTSAGRRDWIGRDADELAGIARALTADASRLDALRAGLRAEVADRPLFDPKGFARGFVEALLKAIVT